MDFVPSCSLLLIINYEAKFHHENILKRKCKLRVNEIKYNNYLKYKLNSFGVNHHHSYNNFVYHLLHLPLILIQQIYWKKWKFLSDIALNAVINENDDPLKGVLWFCIVWIMWWLRNHILKCLNKTTFNLIFRILTAFVTLNLR